MLTKKECAAITERANESLKKGGSLYEILFGHTAPDNTTTECDNITIVNRIINLCDTSDMVELPIDKNGVPIHIGDTVWCSGEKETVKAIEIRDSEARIHFVVPLGCESWSSPELITHKKPVTIESLVERFRHVLDKGHMSSWSMAELFDIADKLESLGDSDD